jgi:flagellar protein FlaJ
MEGGKMGDAMSPRTPAVHGGGYVSFNQYATLMFGNFVKKHDRYQDMKLKLRRVHAFKPYEEYVSTAIATSLLIATMGLILGLIIGYIILTRVRLPTLLVYDPTAAALLNFFSPYKTGIWVVISGVLLFVVLGGLVYSVFMIYPSFQANIRKVKIDTQLPHVVTYMYALSKGETNAVEIIRSVAALPNVYGEISNEFAMVLRDMDLLGIDFMTALRNIQKETPSEEFNQFIGNLITLIDNGGDLTDFLAMQIESYRAKTKSEHTLFLDMLGMIAEGYVTGFVAGPLFLIIVAVTLGSMKGSMAWLLMGMTYVVLPFGSIGFVFLVDMMLPKDEQVIGTLSLRKIKDFVRIRKAETTPDETKLFQEYEISKKRIRLENILKDPLGAFYEEPVLSLYISIPAAVITLLIAILLNRGVLFSGYVPASQYLTNYILLSVMIAIIPFIIFYESRSHKINKVESAIPQFLRHISIINETGLSLAESLRVILRTERGALRPYIERMYTDISWGASTTEAFVRFSNKIRVNTLSRMTALITKASESSGDIREVLEAAAKDMGITLQLKKDKSTNMLIYVIIIYISFLVFLYIIYSLVATFLPPMMKASQAGGGGFIRNFNLDFYKVYFYHTALVQAAFSGMMAGVLGEGDPRSGLKHAVVMLLIAFILFRFLVQV